MIQGARSRSTPPRRRLSASVRVLLWIASCAIPPALLWLLAVQDALSPLRVEGLALLGIVWILIVAVAVRAGVLRRVRALSNLVEAAHAQDFSIKAAHARESGELGELYRQLNVLIGDLEAGRHTEQELLGMLQKVVDQISVAIVACDAYDRIRLVNPLAAQLLRVPPEQLIGTDYAATPLAAIPFSAEPRVVDFRFPGAESRWQVSQQFYRRQGRPSRIVFVVDLRLALAEEEILVWQRLIRVISHEVNNSLTPIMSLCQTLENVVARGDAAQQMDIMRDGLDVISQRAKGLKEFISVYARIARLPEPQKVVFPAARLLQRVLAMFPGGAVERVGSEPQANLFGDPVHLEQALINLVKNAVEANDGHAVPVQFGCRVVDGNAEFEIVDNGAGIRNLGNLFVPFYTTKPGGAGVGLVLCRKIAAKHHGQVSLENRGDAPGAVARLSVPLSRDA
ncbi:PAS domain-containing protein [Tahibacter aquaticus]|uniref:histidine kinase n=1 Tax=Tahibacter aquaticus TaxID=520092 RepID=A0A4V3DMI6_9GAMM|nr:ATP-binding protein [Tahibacter aquaticus]TDR44826.1 PAS domain-containing protein [Tahibacter aquaticus]